MHSTTPTGDSTWRCSGHCLPRGLCQRRQHWLPHLSGPAVCLPAPTAALLHGRMQLHLFRSHHRPTWRLLSLKAVAYTHSCFKYFSSFFPFLDMFLYNFPRTNSPIASKATLQEIKKSNFLLWKDDNLILILISFPNNNNKIIRNIISELWTAAQKPSLLAGAPQITLPDPQPASRQPSSSTHLALLPREIRRGKATVSICILLLRQSSTR